MVARHDDGMNALSGWGRVYRPGSERVGEDLERLTERAVLSRGLGRSYGDSALPPSAEREVATTVLADRLVSFDPASGVLVAEAGVSIEQLNRRLLPHHFFVPVTPGTQHVTLGGAVAADVHGKNHHVDGCFGEHVRRLRMRLADGRIVNAEPDGDHADLFWATVGGMGLTGHILEVELAMRRVPSAWIHQETERVPNIDAFMAALDARARSFPFTVGWIDCLSRGEAMGRGIVMAGRWASGDEAPRRYPSPKPRLSLPFDLPSFAVGEPTVRAFNAAFYHRHPPWRTTGVVDYASFFYPLDVVGQWNRIYGKRGFTQYQCVLPRRAGGEAARQLLEVLTARGGASFLCVIKDCGPQGRGLMSFPMEGISIALDIPITDDTQGLVDTLNETVIDLSGRIYLAKDTFSRREHFVEMERERLAVFQDARRKWDPTGEIRSAQSVRLFGDEP